MIINHWLTWKKKTFQEGFASLLWPLCWYQCWLPVCISYFHQSVFLTFTGLYFNPSPSLMYPQEKIISQAWPVTRRGSQAELWADVRLLCKVSHLNTCFYTRIHTREKVIKYCLKRWRLHSSQLYSWLLCHSGLRQAQSFKH